MEEDIKSNLFMKLQQGEITICELIQILINE